MTEEVKVERDSPRKVREDLMARIDEIEAKMVPTAIGEGSNTDIAHLLARIDQLTKAIVESAHVMGWPKDLLESHGIKAFDKNTDKLRVKQ